MAKPTSVDNFWEKVRKSDGCWLWTGSANTAGYGKLTFAGVTVQAHRFVWKLFFGPAPKGMSICHRCDVRRCVRPDHLFLATPDGNSADMVQKGRSARGARNSMTKLSEEDVRFIRANYAYQGRGGLSQVQLGKRFGVSHRAVGLILQGKNWAHLA